MQFIQFLELGKMIPAADDFTAIRARMAEISADEMASMQVKLCTWCGLKLAHDGAVCCADCAKEAGYPPKEAAGGEPT